MLNPNCFCDAPVNVLLLASAIAKAISEDMTSTEINYYGNILNTVSQNMFMIAAQKEMCENNANEESVSGDHAS